MPKTKREAQYPLINNLEPKSRSLIMAFILDRAERYVEPEKKGTPKGTPVGLSKQKYAATLFAMLQTDLQQVANFMNVKYGVLRKWRSEPSFWRQVDEHAKAFILDHNDVANTRLRPFLRIRGDQHLAAYKSKLKRAGSKSDSIEVTMPDEDRELSDIRFWSKSVIDVIHQALFGPLVPAVPLSATEEGFLFRVYGCSPLADEKAILRTQLSGAREAVTRAIEYLTSPDAEKRAVAIQLLYGVPARLNEAIGFLGESVKARDVKPRTQKVKRKDG